jgi:hypothetical protein
MAYLAKGLLQETGAERGAEHEPVSGVGDDEGGEVGRQHVGEADGAHDRERREGGGEGGGRGGREGMWRGA